MQCCHQELRPYLETHMDQDSEGEEGKLQVGVVTMVTMDIMISMFSMVTIVTMVSISSSCPMAQWHCP